MKITHQQENNLQTTWSKKIKRLITGDSSKKSFAKIKGSSLAIILGLVIGMIPILIANGNPLLGYWAMITGPFSKVALHRTIAIISVFIILGAGIGLSFRTGLFNIGATGQFLMAGFVCVMIGQQTVLNNALNKPSGILILLLVAALVGALVAAIPGFLKAFFNVHEVVTTILLNWIIFYIVRWIVSLPGIGSDDGTTSLPSLPNLRFSLGNNSFDYLFIIFFALVLVTLLFVVFKYTTFGYRLKLNGLSDSVAKYSGINIKSNIIYAMMISGAFAGIAGFIFYSSIEGVVPRYDTLITIGFQAITVTLLAFSSPLGTILSGFFYGVLYQGQNFMQIGAGGNVVRETASLSLGMIIFMSALAVILVNVHPLKTIISTYRLYSSKKIQKLRHQHRLEKITLLKKYDQLLAEAKRHHEDKKHKLQILKNQWASDIAKINRDYQRGKIDILEKDEIINRLNHQYASKIDRQKLNEYHNILKNKEIACKELNNKFKFSYAKSLSELEENLAEIKKNKNDLLTNLNVDKSDKLKRELEVKKIKQLYQAQKKQILVMWKGTK